MERSNRNEVRVRSPIDIHRPGIGFFVLDEKRGGYYHFSLNDFILSTLPTILINGLMPDKLSDYNHHDDYTGSIKQRAEKRIRRIIGKVIGPIRMAEVFRKQYMYEFKRAKQSGFSVATGGVTYMNVTGKMVDAQGMPEELPNSYYAEVAKNSGSYAGLAVLFDATQYALVEDKDDLISKRKIVLNILKKIGGHAEVDSQGRVGSEHGFNGGRRIPPKDFLGLVFLGQDRGWQKKVVSMLERLSVKYPRSVIPLYDEQGNMIWPERIPYTTIHQEHGTRPKAR